MLEWINNRFGTDFTEADLTNIKEFALMWNIFEKIVCDTRCTLNTIKRRTAEIDFDLSGFEEHLTYFKTRYVEAEQTNERFNYLRINNTAYSELVRSVLLNEEGSEPNQILAMLVIVYRYRNNLFHGNKNIRYLDTQEINFYHANQILCKVLDHF